MYIYAIYDDRQKEYVTDPMFLENDIQAAMAYRNFQNQLVEKGLIVKDLRLMNIGYLDKGEQEPIKCTPPEETPTYLQESEN